MQLSKVAEIQLISSQNEYAIRGEDRLLGWFEIRNENEYTDGVIDSLGLYNIKNNMKEFERDYIYRYKEFYNVEVIDYEEVCSEKVNVNGSIEKYDCFQKEIGNHSEKKFNWIIFDSKKDLPKGNITIGIFADVLPNEHGEWIITLFGVRIPEWSEWTESLNVDLVSYWALNGTAGTVNDSLGLNNGTNNGATRGVAGIINNAFTFDGNDYVVVSETPSLDISDVITLQAWVYSSGRTDYDYFFGKQESHTGYELAIASNGNLSFAIGTTEFQGGLLPTGEWVHAVGVYNGSDMKVYINGEYTSTAKTGAIPLNNGNVVFGRWPSSAAHFFNGKLDELAIWNRPLTSEEVTQLYNEGNGITYEEPEEGDTTPPYFTNGTPTNQTIVYGTALNYNINATDEIEFGCFDINDTINFNINCSGYLENNTLLSFGLYNLNVSINDTSGNENSTLFWVNVTKGNPSTNMVISGTTPIEYNTTSDFSESETNTGDGGCSYSMDRGNIVYGVGTWTFNYSTSGCDNYTAGSVIKDLVVDINNTLVLGLTATTPVEYPFTTDFVGSGCPGELSCSLNISNTIHPAGIISVNYSTSGNDNYSATSIDFAVTINQNSSYILGISGTTPIIYGTITDVVGSGCLPGMSCALDKINDIYGVGVSPLTFNYSTIGNTNYTANSITKDIIINIAGDTFTTELNGVEDNLTITFPQQVNVSVSNNLTIVTIDVNGTTFTNGNNYTLGGGVWFVNVSTEGNQNYSANESHWYITINQAGNPITTLLNGVADNLTITFPQQVNVSVSNNLTIATIDVNGTTFTNGNNYTLGANIWFVNISTIGTQNYTSNESHWYITMNKATPTGTLAGTSPITYGTIGDVVGTETNVEDNDLVYRLLRDETIVSNPDATVLGVGVYNYIYNVTGGQNYTSVASLDTFALTVNIETGDGTLLLNGSATNYTINRTVNVNITTTLDTGSGDISVYIDTTLFYSQSSPISNESRFSTLGWYLINFTYPGNENYTGFEKYLYVNVTANPLAIVSIVYPTTGDYEAHFTELNYTILYAAKCWYNLGEGGGYILITCGDNVTGITSTKGSNFWIVKAENLDGFNVTDSVSFTIDLPIEYSAFTLRMVDVLKIFILLAGLFIIVMAGKSFYAGEMTFGRLITIGIFVALGVGAVILLGPILINYISDLIK